jgi:hypothetical protein
VEGTGAEVEEVSGGPSTGVIKRPTRGPDGKVLTKTERGEEQDRKYKRELVIAVNPGAFRRSRDSLRTADEGQEFRHNQRPPEYSDVQLENLNVSVAIETAVVQAYNSKHKNAWNTAKEIDANVGNEDRGVNERSTSDLALTLSTLQGQKNRIAMPEKCYLTEEELNRSAQMAALSKPSRTGDWPSLMRLAYRYPGVNQGTSTVLVFIVGISGDVMEPRKVTSAIGQSISQFISSLPRDEYTYLYLKGLLRQRVPGSTREESDIRAFVDADDPTYAERGILINELKALGVDNPADFYARYLALVAPK